MKRRRRREINRKEWKNMYLRGGRGEEIEKAEERKGRRVGQEMEEKKVDKER